MIVAPVAIGIATDDTIHFLTAYGRGLRQGLPAPVALRSAIGSVGAAVIITSTALTFGFLSMVTSPFASIGNLGSLSAIAIAAATLSDLLVLPAIVLATHRSPHLQRAFRVHPRRPSPESDGF